MPRVVNSEDVGNVDPFVYEAVQDQTDLVMPIVMEIPYGDGTLKGTFFQTWRHKIVNGLRDDGEENMIWLACRDDDPECALCKEAKTNSHVEPSEAGNARVARLVVALRVIASKGPREKTFHPVGACAIYRFSGKNKRNQLAPILERAKASKQQAVFCIKGDGGKYKNVTISAPSISDDEIKKLASQVKDSMSESFAALKKSGEFDRMIIPPDNAELKTQLDRFLKADASTDFDTEAMDGGTGAVDDPFADASSSKSAEDAAASAAKSDDPFGLD